LKRDVEHRIHAAPRNRLLKGEHLARRLHCFRCHGELGQGGKDNAGALKGYIPGYFGNDFQRLTDNARLQIVSEWITSGAATVVTEHPLTGGIARWFLARQEISMPRFSNLSGADLALLVDYVVELSRYGPLDEAGLARYAHATRLRRHR
jgi:hypothetical protein